jgi:chaperonin GroEL
MSAFDPKRTLADLQEHPFKEASWADTMSRFKPVEEGILPGGGVALLRSVEALKRLNTGNEDQKHGVEIVRKAIQMPARQIAINGEYGNLVTKGIIDPTKVVRCALQGAVSVAGLLITTEAMVAEVPKKESAAPAMPGGGMGGMDY